ncbi:hypothetical protein POM88_009001 [Heracleum sosnowskyi]|uniref:Uncharacterized protein n=1 Tax=Heracleum sosnowskyi TaxID=360622 RepID=A0AAD8N945_9APIA|nr:hypothetical protein POM88_009001 [Heracleum sosnowskyi]
MKVDPPSSQQCDPLCSVDETSSQEFEVTYQPKTDILKALAIFAAAATATLAINHSLVAANQDVAMALLFGIGYAGIIFEESLAFNKSGVGLLMAVCLWVIRSIGAPSTDIAVTELSHASGEVSEIVFFLLGAMTIVEIVDAHQGFKLITDNITTRKPRTLLWVVGFVTFFLWLDTHTLAKVDPLNSSESEEGGGLIAPQEVFNRFANVVQEAIKKMKMVEKEKLRMVKKARLAVEAYDQELKDKAREVVAVKMDRQRKKQ